MKPTSVRSDVFVGHRALRRAAYKCTTLLVAVCMVISPGCGGAGFLGLQDYQRDILFSLGSLAISLLAPGLSPPMSDDPGQSEPALPGEDGINCWDLNGNGQNDSGEDVNDDGQFNALDCQAVDGATGAAGSDGQDGQSGEDGADGEDGTDGSTGPAGSGGGGAGGSGPAGPPGGTLFDTFIDGFFTVDGGSYGSLNLEPGEEKLPVVRITEPALGVCDDNEGLGVVGYRVAVSERYTPDNPVTMRLYIWREGPRDENCFVFRLDAFRASHGTDILPYGDARYIRPILPGDDNVNDNGDSRMLLVIDLPLNEPLGAGLGFPDDLDKAQLLAFEINTLGDFQDGGCYTLVGVDFYETAQGGAVGIRNASVFASQGDIDCNFLCVDSDGDGLGDPEVEGNTCPVDGCPDDPNKGEPGVCGCGKVDGDSDGDGTQDCNDGCPEDPNKSEPGACGCSVSDGDGDQDGTPNCNDGCPEDSAKTEPGACGCGVADTDTDGDGIPDCNDMCPEDGGKAGPGACGCGTSDEDSDGDGTADCNDGCPEDPDKIEPGICGCGASDTDSDQDGAADCKDGCPEDSDKIDPGVCGCGASDEDSDQDGIADCIDQCPGIPDADTDGDGTLNCEDGCPDDATKTEPGQCGCGISDVDSDEDGTADCHDMCPNDPAKTHPGQCGCGNADVDSDGDGTADCNDGCPSDAGQTEPGACGCGNSDADSDGDGTVDCNDGCPDDANKTEPGACGCGQTDVDSDGDGFEDCNDGCPNDAAKTEPGACGCGEVDTDSDQDGIADCNDGCPDDPAKAAPGQCGCGQSDDADADGDAVPDCVDVCPDSNIDPIVDLIPQCDSVMDVPNTVDENGCSVIDLFDNCLEACACVNPNGNDGSFQNCVSKDCADILIDLGIIPNRGAITSCTGGLDRQDFFPGGDPANCP